MGKRINDFAVPNTIAYGFNEAGDRIENYLNLTPMQNLAMDAGVDLATTKLGKALASIATNKEAIKQAGKWLARSASTTVNQIGLAKDVLDLTVQAADMYEPSLLAINLAWMKPKDREMVMQEFPESLRKDVRYVQETSPVQMLKDQLWANKNKERDTTIHHGEVGKMIRQSVYPNASYEE